MVLFTMQQSPAASAYGIFMNLQEFRQAQPEAVQTSTAGGLGGLQRSLTDHPAHSSLLI